MKVTIGIDPGQQGAVVRIDERGTPVFVDTPTLRTTNSKGKARTMYNEPEMARLLRNLAFGNDAHVVIEQVNAMPKQGVASSFNFGMGYGIWLGIIAALALPSTRVTPVRWKKDVLADAPKTDQAVVGIAARLYPAASAELRGPRGAMLLGRADALLIAHWWRTSSVVGDDALPEG